MGNESKVLEAIVRCHRGSVIAPAGCGKTEQIACAVVRSSDRRLILTHTIAGIDALRGRLKELKADPAQYEIATIAAWALRLASSFPVRSSLIAVTPDGGDWDSVYVAAAKLIGSGAINGIIKASYAGVFVDEYQDCTKLQHTLIRLLADILPCCVFGDPLQSIFSFRGNLPPDWASEVLHVFPQIAELKRPWRWDRVGNQELGKWLLDSRDQLASGQLDLRGAPGTVNHLPLTAFDENARKRQMTSLVAQALGQPDGEKCIVIGESQNETGRALLARDVKATSIEPISCKRLAKFVSELEGCQGQARLDLVLDCVKDVMTKSDVAEIKKVVAGAIAGKRRRTPLNEVQSACVEIVKSQDLRPILHLLEGLPRHCGGWVYRRELLSSLCGALRGVVTGAHATLADAVWDVQNRRRHSGRRLGQRNIGSTLLVKGLQFDHAIIVDVEKLKRNDLYVAITRGARSLTVISQSNVLRPKP